VCSGVAVKAAAQLVVHAAPGHAREGEADHLQRAGVAASPPEAQHRVPDHGLGKLGGTGRAALALVAALGHALEGVEQDLVGEHGGGGTQPLALTHLLEELLSRLRYVAAARAIGLGYSLQHPRKGGHAVTLLRPALSAAVQEHAIRSRR